MKVIRTIKNAFLFQWIRDKYFPEAFVLLKLSWPLMLMNLCRYLNPTISVIMCGHLTKIDFDAASVANALINVFGVAVDLGFSTACDTLFAQIYGSKNKKRLGIMLQRAALVMTLVYLILACFHLNIEPLLILLSQDVEISRRAALYVSLYLPGLFFDFQFLTMSRYLQNQNIVYPMMVASIVGCIFNAVVQYLFIYVFNYGIEASAITQAIACAIMFFVQLIYIIFSRVYQSTWQGFEFANALEGWGIFFKLGLPGIVMLGIEEWTFEIANFIAGALSDIQLGAQSVGFQTAFLFYMVHCGVGIGGSIRVGQFLGADMPDQASLSAKVAIITDFLISLITSAIILSSRTLISYIFTNDEEIRLFAEKILILIGAFQLIDACATQAGSILRACGKQLMGAIVMSLCYYTLGVPLGLVMMFVIKTDIRGFWISLYVGLITEVIIYYTIVFRINWTVEAVKTTVRIQESRLGTDQNELIKDDFSYEKITENTSLIDDNEGFEHFRRHSSSSSRYFHRRPTSGVTDILAATIKDVPNVSSYNRFNRKTVLKRSIFFGIVLVLFISSIFSKIYLPRRLYIPCIGNNGSSLPLNKHYPFCNDSMYSI